MNRDDIIRMAQECHLIGMRPHLDGIYQQSLEHFATLIAAAEREACAQLADEHAPYWAGYKIANAIRARGEE